MADDDRLRWWWNEPENAEERALLESVLERMQRAGWIDAVVRTEKEITPQITELGRDRFAELLRLWDELDVKSMPGVGWNEWLMMISLIRASGQMPEGR